MSSSLIWKSFLCIPASADDAVDVNPNGKKELLADGLNTFMKPVFSNGPRNLPKNHPECTILDSCVFDNFILAYELLAKALQSLETLSDNNNLWGN